MKKLYMIIRTNNGVDECVCGSLDYEKVHQKFDDMVTAFLDGEREEPAVVSSNSDTFYFEYEDGETYMLEILPQPASVL